jgi:protein-tyrosine phosphatase
VTDAPTITELTVEADEPGALVVRWSLDGGDAPVDVATGSSPRAIDHERARAVAAGETSIRLSDLPPARTYVSVGVHGGGGAVIAAARRLPFEGVTNFRDLGGYRTRGGGRTAWGHLFRADALHRFTEADRAAYAELGVRAVYDLRGELEAANRPNPVASTLVPLLSRPADAPPLTQTDNSARVDHLHGEQLLRDMYVGMLEHAGPTFGRLLRAFADADARPAVFHCTGGKDRTGMTAALLLELLGVDRDDVLDDYELTSRYRLRHQQENSYETLVRSGLGPEAAGAVLGTPRWAMAEALTALDATYGGIDAYLLDRAGLEPATLDELRRHLVD